MGQSAYQTNTVHVDGRMYCGRFGDESDRLAQQASGCFVYPQPAADSPIHSGHGDFCFRKI